MKSKIFLFLVLFFLFGCKKNVKNSNKTWFKISERIQYQENNLFLELKSGNHYYKIPTSKLPFKKIIILNASLVGYISELGAEQKMVGVSSPEYIFSEKMLNLIQEKQIEVVGNEQKYDIEKILALKPDAVFSNHIESYENTYEILRKNGIEVIFIDEYLEQNPLEKTKIIEIFGKLLGNSEKAIAVYSEIEKNYLELKKQASKIPTNPLVLSNEMYGNQWFLPGGNTFVAHYIQDANASYILKNNNEKKAIPMSFEEVFVKSENAKFWINVGNHKTKSELLQINPNYAKMNVYKNGKLYAVTAKEKKKANDFFESGIVRADLVLKDYIAIFHPKLFPNYKLMYLQELK